MLKIKVKKGHNINIAGVASSEILAPQKNTTVSLSPENFRYIKPKLLVKENDSVKLFTKLNADYFCKVLSCNLGITVRLPFCFDFYSSINQPHVLLQNIRP